MRRQLPLPRLPVLTAFWLSVVRDMYCEVCSEQNANKHDSGTYSLDCMQGSPARQSPGTVSHVSVHLHSGWNAGMGCVQQVANWKSHYIITKYLLALPCITPRPVHHSARRVRAGPRSAKPS